MKSISRHQTILVAALVIQLMALMMLSGCSERDLATLPKATAPADGLVFGDGFSNLDYAAHEFSFLEAMSVESTGGVVRITRLAPASRWPCN